MKRVLLKYLTNEDIEKFVGKMETSLSDWNLVSQSALRGGFVDFEKWREGEARFEKEYRQVYDINDMRIAAKIFDRFDKQSLPFRMAVEYISEAMPEVDKAKAEKFASDAKANAERARSKSTIFDR